MQRASSVSCDPACVRTINLSCQLEAGRINCVSIEAGPGFWERESIRVCNLAHATVLWAKDRQGRRHPPSLFLIFRSPMLVRLWKPGINKKNVASVTAFDPSDTICLAGTLAETISSASAMKQEIWRKQIPGCARQRTMSWHSAVPVASPISCKMEGSCCSPSHILQWCRTGRGESHRIMRS